MEKILKAALCVFLSVGFLSCSQSADVNICLWDNYINPDVVAKFENQYGAKVTIRDFGTAKAIWEHIKDPSRTEVYDLLIVPPNLAKRLYFGRYTRTMDHSQIPNIENLKGMVINASLDPLMRYSVPYMVSFTGIVYNKSIVKDFTPTWNMFSRTDLAGKMGLIDDIRQVMGAVIKSKMFNYSEADGRFMRRKLKFLVYNIDDNPNWIKEITSTVEEWKKNTVLGSPEELTAKFKAGELYVCQSYNGDALRMVSENSNVGFVIPGEGTNMDLDCMVVPYRTTREDASYRFVNFMLEPEVAKMNMEYLMYYAPNEPALKLMSNSFLNNPDINPPQSIIMRSNFIEELDDSRKLQGLWDLWHGIQ